MNFTLMPSLKYITLVKVTTELWNLCDIRDLMARSSTGYSDYSSNYKEWQQEIEHKIIEKVPELPLPELLKKEILYFIRPIGLQIYKWKTYLCGKPSLCQLLSNEEYTKSLPVLCWTPQGTVEQKYTAKTLIKDGNLDVTERYALACNFCLEDDVKELWNLLPQTKKVAFYDGHPSFSVLKRILVVLWTYDIKGELIKLNGLFRYITGTEIPAYKFAFIRAAMHGNKTATEYFLWKLTPLERQESFVWYARYVAIRHGTRYPTLYADVLCFLLSQMNEEQQVKVFEGNPYAVLSCLLDWPWQSFFMEAANRMWNFLSEQDYLSVLRNIVNKVSSGFKDFNYHKLFGEFWKQGPSACKKYFIGTCASDVFFIQVLFEYKDKENIRLILKYANVKEKEEILFNFISNYICCRVIYTDGDNWDLLKFIVEECLSSEDMMIKFKEEFKRRIEYASRQRSEKEKISEFCQILYDLIHRNSKKGDVEEGTSSPSKKRLK